MPPEEIPTESAETVPDLVIGAIPARFGSTRLPGKPLRVIAGRPLIEHVFRRASEAKELDRVVVLSDDRRVVEAVETFGGLCELTPQDCVSGTDRIAWAARQWPGGAAIVNIQGDEPLIDPAAIDRVASHLRQHPEDPLVTLATMADPGDEQNPDTVKVVLDRQGYALYFSRSAIPYTRNVGAAPTLRHLGIYGYQRGALQRLAELGPTPLERSESLEQLRALENGIRIRVMLVDQAWTGVDTMEDLKRVEALLANGGSARPA